MIAADSAYTAEQLAHEFNDLDSMAPNEYSLECEIALKNLVGKGNQFF